MTDKIISNHYWGKAVGSFFIVLLLMPLGHAMMKIMEGTMPPTALHISAFGMGLIGWVMAIWGIFVKGDTRQTLMGLIGGLLFWTGWIEFLLQYFAQRVGAQPEIVNGEVVTQPEYLLMPATFGFYMLIMTFYLFCTRVGCNWINWWQRLLLGRHCDAIVVHPVTRHVSIVTFMELNMIMWTSYLLLMFLYDPAFFGDHHPVTYAVGIFCLIGAMLIFRKQLRLPRWGANIRMAVATVVVFWVPVEIAGRINLFREVWVEPRQYSGIIWGMLIALVVLVSLMIFNARRTKSGR